MKTRIYHTKTWRDAWFSNLSKDAKHLWNYLLLNEKINISGIYELSDREIIFDTSLDTSLLESLKKELEPKATFFEGWVRILNVEKYNKYRNSPSNETAYQKELSYIPDAVCKGLSIQVDTSVYTLRNKKQEIITTKLKLRNEKSEVVASRGFKNVGEILKKT